MEEICYLVVRATTGLWVREVSNLNLYWIIEVTDGEVPHTASHNIAVQSLAVLLALKDTREETIILQLIKVSLPYLSLIIHIKNYIFPSFNQF